MRRPLLKKLATAFLIFVLGIGVGIFSHTLVSKALTAARSGDFAEAARVNSPDGKLDAVLVEDISGGALGGVFWSVYVVRKGRTIRTDATTRLFFADELTKGAIVWSKPHLIEIHYDKASIMEFRNISTISENGLEYVELRLVPSSE
ncbi:MAG TPA: hypothetical protein VOA78_15585 [Candidatus Dormibacteraeota bacterium]|nr:hypothetical protein [Candidatus Dormibacteraeota bacterium]